MSNITLEWPHRYTLDVSDTRLMTGWLPHQSMISWMNLTLITSSRLSTAVSAAGCTYTTHLFSLSSNALFQLIHHSTIQMDVIECKAAACNAMLLREMVKVVVNLLVADTCNLSSAHSTNEMQCINSCKCRRLAETALDSCEQRYLCRTTQQHIPSWPDALHMKYRRCCRLKSLL